MAEVIDGKQIAHEMRLDIRKKFDLLKDVGAYPPKLVSVTVGKEKDARLYAKAQEKAAAEVGVDFDALELKSDISQEDLLRTIAGLNLDDSVTAVVVQQPLPVSLDHDKIVSALDPGKDAEGIHPYNLGRIFRREADILPCTPGAVMKILNRQKIDLYGKDVVIIGHSAIVGKPLSLMMLNETATTSVCHIGTSEKGDIKIYTRRADILVVAVGKAQMVKADWVKEGAVVIDVGINDVSGKIIGDVDFEDVSRVASKITPVPGGVGPVTVSILMRNVLRAYSAKNEKIQRKT